MKLALVIEKYDPQGGGAERSTRQIALELVSRGHDVTVVCAQCPIEVDGEIKINLLPKSGQLHALRLRRFASWAAEQLQQGCFDATVSMTTTVPGTVLEPRSGTARETMQRNLAMYGLGAQFAKGILNKISAKKRALLDLERKTLASPILQHIAANSHYVIRQLTDIYQFPSERMSVIPNAATLPEFTVEQRATWRKSIRSGYQIAENQVVFVFAAMNPYLKGLTPLMVAFAKLIEKELPVSLLLAGKYEKKHLDFANKLGIRKHIRFVGPTHDMVQLYAASDVLVHPTFYDPSSKVVIEALMMGIPAISTRYNGASDLILPEDREPRGCVINNPTDIDDLVTAMSQMVDRDIRKAFADATVGLSESLSMTRHVDQLETLLKDLIARV